ncbi:hypothetical protein BDR06DRAFT_967618 [Suillus hirtellus]|nr:hypothetical protein BDR06DRAFT_967618 [Suillus hirtellus]
MTVVLISNKVSDSTVWLTGQLYSTGVTHHYLALRKKEIIQSHGPGQARIGQAKPGQRSWPDHGFGLAQDVEKPKPAAQATASVLKNGAFIVIQVSLLHNLLINDPPYQMLKDPRWFTNLRPLMIGTIHMDNEDELCVVVHLVCKTKPTAALLQHSERAALPSQMKAINDSDTEASVSEKYEHYEPMNLLHLSRYNFCQTLHKPSLLNLQDKCIQPKESAIWN